MASGKFLVAFAITLLAALGAMMVHYGLLGWQGGRGDGFTFGIGVFGLVGAFMLYRLFFLACQVKATWPPALSWMMD